MRNSSSFPSEDHAIKCELAAEVLRSSGKLRLQVDGWSMLPSVFPGDTLFIERTQGHEVAEGDIVLFSRDRRLFAHRVVRKMSKTQVLTRGDCMAAPDPLVQYKEILGRVIQIVRNGESIRPRQQMRTSERAIAAVVRHSNIAARLVIGIHGLRRPSSAEVS